MMLGKSATEVRRLLQKAIRGIGGRAIRSRQAVDSAVGGFARGGGMTLAVSATCWLQAEARRLVILKLISASFLQFTLCICHALSAVIAPSALVQRPHLWRR